MEIIKLGLLLLVILLSTPLKSQRFPSKSQNIEHLAVFGNEAAGTWGDSDNIQAIFIMVPEWIEHPVYLRVFDPDTGGKYDEANQDYNTSTKFTLYAGSDVHPANLTPNWEQSISSRSGVPIDSIEVGLNPELDNQWYTFKPLDPTSGQSYFGFRVFKILVEGLKGDDGNLYNFFLSSSPEENVEINLANFFSYELSFCLPQNGRVNVYPYLQNFTEDIYISVYDFDNSGEINFRPPSGPILQVPSSGNGEWKTSSFGISSHDYNQFSALTIFCDGQIGPNYTTIHVTSGEGVRGKPSPYCLFASPAATFRPEGLTPKFSRK